MASSANFVAVCFIFIFIFTSFSPPPTTLLTASYFVFFFPLKVFDPCSPNPCSNGDCISDYDYYSYSGVSYCECFPGFEGEFCESAFSFSFFFFLFSFFFLFLSFSFQTVQPFFPFFFNIATRTTSTLDKVNPCDATPCANGGTCIEQTETFFCECPFGFVGESCDLGEFFFIHLFLQFV